MQIATYERVSTIEQSTENQRPALAAWVQTHPDAVLVRPYRDVESGAKTSRPGFDRMVKDARAGMFTTLVIWRLDRLGRSTEHLLRTVRELEECGVTLVSVRDSIDTSTASGKAFLGMLAVFAQFERDILVERTKAGMARAKANGKHVGRPQGSKDGRPRATGQRPTKRAAQHVLTNTPAMQEAVQ
jgi:DNA invertase Pin-like site-specific DNA recombinase